MFPHGGRREKRLHAIFHCAEILRLLSCSVKIAGKIRLCLQLWEVMLICIMSDVIAVNTGIVTRQQAVVDRIRELIMDGTFAGGHRLIEVALSEQMGVSRTPIREALIVLTQEGLAEYRPNRGYVVRDVTLPYIMDAYVVREALEGLACRLAAEKGVSRQMRNAMEEILEDGDRLLSGPTLSPAARDPWGEVNHRLHDLIVASADSAALNQALSSATSIAYSSSRVVHWFDEGDAEGLFQLRSVHAQHHAIVQAICNGEGYRAESIMRSHIAYAADHIRSKYFAKNPSTRNGVAE